jgi:beta-barrel assembly-enhancing protease
MKRIGVFIGVFLVAVSAIYFSERRHDSTPVSANAIVEVAADAQRDLSRVPMRLTRLSDDQEIAIGNELAKQYSINSDKVSPEELALDGYIRGVGGTVASHAHRHLPYSFHLLPNRSMINAFSLPGGSVTSGRACST